MLLDSGGPNPLGVERDAKIKDKVFKNFISFFFFFRHSLKKRNCMYSSYKYILSLTDCVKFKAYGSGSVIH